MTSDSSAVTGSPGCAAATPDVYPAEAMRELRTWFETALADRLAAARVLYWT